MALQICSLASGSGGNCIYVASDNCKILVDAGIPFSTIKNRLKDIGAGLDEISSVIVTHEHTDHIASLDKLNQAGIPVYAHERAQQAIVKRTGRLCFAEVDFYDGGFQIEDILVRPFRLPHDAAYPLGYSFQCGDDVISVATDIGHITDGLINNLSGSRIVLLEANHDRELLLNNPKYPKHLKKRIDGANGHFSNDASGEVLKQILNKNLERIILAHLSEKNNSPEMAFSTVVEALAKVGAREGRDLIVDVASQNCPTQIF